MIEGPLVGGIELGGTKINLVTGTVNGTILTRATIPTREPALVMPAIVDFFATASRPVQAVGVGAFGPLLLDPHHPGFGRLLETNKPGWSGFDLYRVLTAQLGTTVHLVTDVAAAAIGESQLGALKDKPLGLYLTVGTGIGGAIVAHGRILPAMLHPEIGHIIVQRQPDDNAPSACRFHADCAEGLAAGPAIMARFGENLSHWASGSAQHRLIANYLGQLCATLVLTLSPHRIVIGGGVGQTAGLLPLMADAMLRHLGGYGPADVGAADFLCRPALGQDAGVIGALLCAAMATPAASPAMA